MRVLILDSSPIFRMGLKQIMTQIGKNNGDLVEVYEGDNISDGVNIAKCYNPDIILLDENIGISESSYTNTMMVDLGETLYFAGRYYYFV